MDTKILGIIISCILFIIMYVFAHIKIVPSNSTNNKANLAQQYVDKFNEYSSKFTEIANKYVFLLEAKKREIVLNNDSITLMQLNDFTDDFNSFSSECENYLLRAKDCFESKNYTGMNYCFDMLKENIEQMEILYECVKQLVVADKNFFKKDTVNNFSQDNEKKCNIKQIGFFIGCNDLEAVNTRYKALAKVMHPDSKTGSTDAFRKLNTEYEEIKNGI